MIEPTETESKPTLDAFVEAMTAITKEARSDPAQVKAAPHRTPVRRLDEVKAARELVLSDRAALSLGPLPGPAPQAGEGSGPGGGRRRRDE